METGFKLHFPREANAKTGAKAEPVAGKRVYTTALAANEEDDGENRPFEVGKVYAKIVSNELVRYDVEAKM